MAVWCATSPTQAQEPWFVDIEAAGGAPLNAPQSDLFAWGGSVSATLTKSLFPWVAVFARARTAGFSDGLSPSDPLVYGTPVEDPRRGFRDPGSATLFTASLGAQLRYSSNGLRRATGPWLDGAFGFGTTGNLRRPSMEAGVGYGFALGNRIALGPMGRYIHILQPDSTLGPADARIAVLGVRLSLFDHTGLHPASPPDGPMPDQDLDGIRGAEDRCPEVAEDLDKFDDGDGCPDPDNDHDGIVDGSDACPLKTETFNGESDADGCPDEGLFVMQNGRIVLSETQLFNRGKAQLEPKALPVLSAIATFSKQHPEWQTIRIEGHTGALEAAAINQQLSEQRAMNVRNALIEGGLPADAIVAKGLGDTGHAESNAADESTGADGGSLLIVLARDDDLTGIHYEWGTPVDTQEKQP